MSDMAHEPPDFKDMGEEELWDLINDNRHAISLGVRPCMLIPYLRQARVLSDLDEDEILTCLKFTNRSMRTSHMLDLLRIQGCNGAVALLEGLMIHYPTLYTQVTGRKPSTEPSRFSGLIKYSELTEYLVRAVTGMQKELQAEREEAAQLRSQCCSLQTELSRVTQQLEEQKSLQAEHTRLRKSHIDMHRDLLKLKDEKCDLYVRYAAAVEEKSEVNIRCRDLNLQVYQLQCELRKAQTETEFQRHRSVKRASSIETQQLRDEIITLRRQLQQAENITPACQDILAQDLEEAKDRRTELAEELRRLQDENEALTRERSELLEEKDCLALEVQKLTLDCEMYQQKSSIFQTQFGELQAERDRAYLARDEAQAQIACSLAEKDTLRAQLVDLQEEIFTLRAHKTQRDSSQSSERSLSWDSGRDLSCDSSPSSPLRRPRLRRMNALPPGCANSFEYSKYSDDGFNSARSSLVEPPCSDSLRRRGTDPEFSDHSPEISDDSFCMLNLESDFEFLCKDDDEGKISLSPDSPETTGVSRASAPPFLVRSRPQAVRITSRALTLSFQGEALLSQLQVIGGNKTGVFVHTVSEDSPAQSMGISPGAQILEVKFQKEQRALRMHLEDSTMEEALWALGQVNGPCSLSLRPKKDAYQSLLQQLKSHEVTSGDSFYVRVNMSLAGGGAGMLSVTCNDILHVTDSHYGCDGYWWASHVHSCQLMDLKGGGRVPNFYRAQRQLIRAIEDLSFQHQAPRKVERAQVKQKAVRIVSTARQGRNPLWVSVEEDNNTNSPSDEGTPGSVSLMPYTLVTPHYPPVCRPVLLLPTILRGIFHKRLAEREGYQLCEPETLSASEHAVRMQKGEVLEECEPNTHCCYTVQGVEKIMKRGTHCVLPLGLDCVRRLHRAEIFPIIIFIASTERSARKFKHKLRQNLITEAQLLECSWSEEPLLDKLPCLYRTVPPDSWSDSAALLDNVQHIVQEEQRKIVWVEPDLW
ncbi:hypothetical protein PHYPO_G00110100 [Pangasianodon hypophthalmus]|uniref:CARD domain-containing protein n=1 Tax=Pangasianodon hypophthalmus TaxID=310915 RepID=A0A5N5PYA2_PANHP|nr:caspase recruitment domain-containing protein 14 isoform X2 [Pangasianodon hypophthalmus]KAB5584664.1 hypothetical protein PHYPO_G00110100 [Pangasianodon hypophthalmus]